ncbi:MAG: Holliday junction DNA helicase RuvA [Chloroflexi bacterium RBG_13_46_9]|nr:MAG: Holliday junction DNA helicase RuvA [Chloroflexi bacterium RBG_13_46_9]
MIASLQGIVDAIGTDWMVVNVGGVGFKVSVPTSVLSEGGITGHEIKLFTHLHVREDEMTLYGFAAPEDLRLFDIFLTVSGLGPKTALNMLSAMSSDQLSLAIATASVEMLTSISGIGKKTADRIILELKDKVGAFVTVTPAGRIAQENTDVLSALTSLGYSIAEASRAIAIIPSDKKLSLEERIKLALQYLGK